VTPLKQQISTDTIFNKKGDNYFAANCRNVNFCNSIITFFYRKFYQLLSGNFGYMERRNPLRDLDQMWRMGRYSGRNHVCNIWWLSVEGCGCGEMGNFALSHWLELSPLQHWSTTSWPCDSAAYYVHHGLQWGIVFTSSVPFSHANIDMPAGRVVNGAISNELSDF